MLTQINLPVNCWSLVVLSGSLRQIHNPKSEINKLKWAIILMLVCTYTTSISDMKIITDKKPENLLYFLHTVKSKQKAKNQAKAWKFSCLNYLIDVGTDAQTHRHQCPHPYRKKKDTCSGCSPQVHYIILDGFECDTKNILHEPWKYQTSLKDEFGIFMVSAAYSCITWKKDTKYYYYYLLYYYRDQELPQQT